MAFCKKFQISILEEQGLEVVQTIKSKFSESSLIYVYFFGQNSIGLSDSLPLYLRNISIDYPFYNQFCFYPPFEIDEDEYATLLNCDFEESSGNYDPYR